MTTRTLTHRELNRTLLSRQLLLEQADIPPLEAIRHLAGLQAQVPNPPYIGLWTRLKQFERWDFSTLLEDRKVVRAPLMRFTLHHMAADDYLRFRKTLEPALLRSFRAFNGKRADGIDFEQMVAAAKAFIEEEPRTTGEQKAMLQQLDPDSDEYAKVNGVRAYLPLVMATPGGLWGSGSAGAYTTPDVWLGQSIDQEARIAELWQRYLAAYGPASIMDFQFWTGLVRLQRPLKELAPALGLLQYEHPNGRTLYDVPDHEVLSADTPAPIRFVPEYDNLIIGHKDRTHIIADADYNKVFLSAARVSATILIDGFVAATWKVEVDKGEAVLKVEPFREVSKDDRETLNKEGKRLLQFIEPEAEKFRVRIN